MRFATPLLILSFIASSTFAKGGPPAAPTSYPVMSGIIDIASPIQIPNPQVGTRLSIPFTGGNFTDTKGNLIATVLPGAGGENGFVDSAGSFHLDGRATLQFVGESDKYAYLQHMGTGDLSAGQGDIWVRCETNSDKYKSLNQAFLWGHVTIPGAYLRVDVFTTTKPT